MIYHKCRLNVTLSMARQAEEGKISTEGNQMLFEVGESFRCQVVREGFRTIILDESAKENSKLYSWTTSNLAESLSMLPAKIRNPRNEINANLALSS